MKQYLFRQACIVWAESEDEAYEIFERDIEEGLFQEITDVSSWSCDEIAEEIGEEIGP